MNTTVAAEKTPSFFQRHIDSLIDDPSLSGVLYQCKSLSAELESLSTVEYPQEALTIRDVLLCVLEHAIEELIHLRDPKDPLRLRRFGSARRVRKLTKLIQKLNSYITFLVNSIPHEAPPAVQVALTELAARYVPGDPPPVCLVIPQWEYNAECTPIMNWLADDIKRDVVDPTDKLQSTSSWDLLHKLWDKRETRLKRSHPFPERLAILSFARLDRYDALIYPLLGHELGHFIDYKALAPLHQEAPLDSHLVSLAEVEQLAAKFGVTDVADWYKWLNEQVQICIRELLADVMAIRILGLPFFLAQAEFLKYIKGKDNTIVATNGYPGVYFRLAVVMNHLLRPRFAGNVRSFFQAVSSGSAEEGSVSNSSAQFVASEMLIYIDTWRNRLGDPRQMIAHQGGDFHSSLFGLAAAAVLDSLADIEKVAEEQVPDDAVACLTLPFFDRVERLRGDLPPTIARRTTHDFAEILTAAWVYALVYGEEREAALSSVDEQAGEYRKVNRLTLKAIELLAAPPHESAPAVDCKDPAGGGVLAHSQLIARLNLPVGSAGRLDVTPLGHGAVQGASIDLRLGNWFMLARRSRLPSVAIRHGADRLALATIGMEETFVPFGHTLLIHPGDFILGVTLEFIALPDDVMAFVEGRSRVGRTGLLVATAAPVAPTFHGVLVLELANTGTVPIEITPGDQIAQLVVTSMTSSVSATGKYRGDYYCQIKPVL